MRRGQLFYNIMTPEEKEKWERAVRYERGRELLYREFPNFEYFISGSFVWAGTLEGHEYWVGIVRKYHGKEVISDLKPYSSIEKEPKIWP
jgi:hypothetical protein